MRKRKCRHCGLRYEPKKEQQQVCSLACSIPYGREQRRKQEAKKHRERKRDLKANDRSVQLKLAQQAFNKFIRLRDSNMPCVSCGRWHQGQWHASHYRPTGQNSALRFNEINCHRACSVCNNHHSGNLIPYRVELVRRIGIQLVEWLEQDHPKTKPWSVEELKAIQQYYKNAVKEMMLTPGDSEPF